MMSQSSPLDAASLASTLGLSTKKKLYVLSPHLDDAVWSIGSALQKLALAGHEIYIINLFSLTVHVYESIRPPAEATAIRKSEDARAATALGVKRVFNLDFPDGVLRDMSLSEVMNCDYIAPPYLLKAILISLADILPKDAVVLAPLALGGHVDHLTTRQTALSLETRLGSLLFFEDLPYVARGRDTQESQVFARAHNLLEVRFTCDEQSIQNHIELYNTYTSQCQSQYASQISAYLRSRGLGFWVADQRRIVSPAA